MIFVPKFLFNASELVQVVEVQGCPTLRMSPAGISDKELDAIAFQPRAEHSTDVFNKQ